MAALLVMEVNLRRTCVAGRFVLLNREEDDDEDTWRTVSIRKRVFLIEKKKTTQFLF